MMKLWLLTQTKVQGYDTYDSAVVAAPTESVAKNIHPDGKTVLPADPFWDTWVSSGDDVTATYLGIAKRGIKKGVICASFNAG